MAVGPTRFLGIATESHSPPGIPGADLPAPLLNGLDPNQHGAGSFLLRPPIAITVLGWFRNVDRISIAYAFRPRLRTRLTLGGLTFPRKPWVFGGQVFHLSYRYSYRHYHFCLVQRTSRYAFSLLQNAPLPLPLARESIASAACLSPGIFSAQDHLTGELLRTL